MPFQQMFPNKKVDFNQFKRFGLVVYVHKNKNLGKFETRAILGILVGYTETGYRVLLQDSEKVVRTSQVRFKEDKVYRDIQTQIKYSVACDDDNEIKNENWFILKTPVPPPVENNVVDNTVESLESSVESSKVENDVTEVDLTSEKCFVAALTTFREAYENPTDVNADECRYVILSAILKDPTSFKEAMKTVEYNLWKKAFDEEIESMRKNNVWQTVPRKSYQNVLDSRVVFKRKIESNSSIRYTARLVVRGVKDRREYDL